MQDHKGLNESLKDGQRQQLWEPVELKAFKKEALFPPKVLTFN